jgi:tRNA U34 2-thiouridine synthase MnmA/TrmU
LLFIIHYSLLIIHHYIFIHHFLVMVEKTKAVALVSGGLDSTLAVKIMASMGIDVQGINFYTGFCVTEHRRKIRRSRDKNKLIQNEALRAGADLGIKIELIDISEDYYKTVLFTPKYGYGSAMNPCVDCRIYMFQKAKEYMESTGAQFVFTGEVLGQRPKSQHMRELLRIANESGLDGRLLRPLSAKLLPPTIPELEGLVDRNKLYDIQGRTRHVQMKLAAEFGVDEYPQPSGGCCFLTDQHYAKKLRDLIAYKGKNQIVLDDFILAKIGRHFRVSEDLKVIVGRDEAENKFLTTFCKKGDHWFFEPVDHQGALTVTDGEVLPEDIELIAGIAAGHCDGKTSEVVRVHHRRNDDDKGIITARPVIGERLEELRI